MTADQVFELGQSEVKRIRMEMEKVMKETGFKGELKDFISFLHTDKQFTPFKTKEKYSLHTVRLKKGKNHISQTCLQFFQKHPLR